MIFFTLLGRFILFTSSFVLGRSTGVVPDEVTRFGQSCLIALVVHSFVVVVREYLNDEVRVGSLRELLETHVNVGI